MIKRSDGGTAHTLNLRCGANFSGLGLLIDGIGIRKLQSRVMGAKEGHH